MNLQDLAPSPTVTVPLRLPVYVRPIDGLPKIMAGGIPVTPLNVAIGQLRNDRGATLASLRTYVRAARYYAEFCGHRDHSLVEVSDAEFNVFQRALRGEPFNDFQGRLVRLSTNKQRAEGHGMSARTADNMIALLYTLTKQIEHIYGVSFDWRRYEGVDATLVDDMYDQLGKRVYASIQRSHRYKHEHRKYNGIPNEQFGLLLRAARARWEGVIVDGDKAYARMHGQNPEGRRGALFFRNLAILLTMRYGGPRRSEVPTIDIDHIDRDKQRLYLATKGHRANGSLGLKPVILFPFVADALWAYLTQWRPEVVDASEDERAAVFVSHDTYNYGRRITDDSVRGLLDALRPALDAPWRDALTPHTLRHAFAYDLQQYGGPHATMAAMRHHSLDSQRPYAANVAMFYDQLVGPLEADFAGVCDQAGLTEVLRGHAS